jgi:hypothetical protein
MSKGLTILITGVLALFIGFLVGRAVSPHQPPGPPPTVTPLPEPCSAKGNHTVTVGPKASDLNGDDCLKLKKDQLLTWVAKDPKRMLTIEFEDQIFDGMTPGHNVNGKQLYVVDCRNRHCFSRSVKSDVPEDGAKHKYWQFLSDDPGGGNPDQADGWIVIDKGQ